MADKYILRITAGPSYDLSSQTEVPVNTPALTTIRSPLADIDLNVRIHNYRGLPRGSPSSSAYFESEPHKANGDQYSIAIRFRPKRPGGGGEESARRAKGPESAKSESQGGDQDGNGPKGEAGSEDELPEGIPAADLQFGNDFDHPIRNRLPPGFNTAMSIVKWWIDPGLDGDAYADTPHLYGPALSSFNAIHVGSLSSPPSPEADFGLHIPEGGSEDGIAVRHAVGIPDSAKERMKWALKTENRDRWVWEYGRSYGLDFFNPYIDFSDFSLRLPGFHVGIMKYWDGQPMRYVLRNRTTKDVYLVVLFTLHRTEDVNEDGTLKAPSSHAVGNRGDETPRGHEAHDKLEKHDEHDEARVLAEARKLLGPKHGEAEEETSIDDVD